MKKDRPSGLQGRSVTSVGARHAVRLFSFLFSCIVLAASVLLLAGCTEKVKPGTAEVKRTAVTGVEAAEILPSPVEEYYEASGTVKAKTASIVASRVMGTVTSVKVREGDHVHAGHVLLILDDRDVAQRVKAAEKALEAAEQNRLLAEVTYDRYKKLYDGKAASKQEIDQIDTQRKVAGSEYERAKAGLAEAQVYYGFTRITAPVSGVVTEKKIDQGSMAVPGTPLLTIEDSSSLRIDVNAGEGLSGALKAGMPADILIGAAPQKISGRISEIVPAVDPMSRTFLVKVEFKGPGLKSGLYAKVRIPVGKREAVLVPKNAIVEKGELTGVYTVGNDDVIRFTLVRTGKTYDDRVEIVSGLGTAERVIVKGVEKAVDGGLYRGPGSEKQG
ncbi:MAG: efflux RND transporter periplasmic adaptor subunit [Nitrospirae bacterium]|nr:efflux RND transporter periplasmic adaptor subunit [Nitrospirota bacterium]